MDYKFCGEKKLDPEAGSGTGRRPLEVPDNSYGHYLAQQSIYAYILKRRYGVSAERSSLLHVATDVRRPVAREVPLTLLPDATVREVFERSCDRSCEASGKASGEASGDRRTS